MELKTLHPSLISWRAILAGLLVTFFSLMIFSALGAGIAGAAIARSLSSGTDSPILMGGAALWMAFSLFLALGLGSFFAARTSSQVSKRVSSAHGVLVASLFFVLLSYGGGLIIGVAGSNLSRLINTAGAGAFDLASDPRLQEFIEDNLGSANLRSEPSVVIQGLANRLLRGDTESALNYFADQTGLPPDEIDSRFATLSERFNQAVLTLGNQAARGFANAGWVLFLMMTGGLAFSVGGSLLAVRLNLRHPLEDEENTAHFVPRPAMT